MPSVPAFPDGFGLDPTMSSGKIPGCALRHRGMIDDELAGWPDRSMSAISPDAMAALRPLPTDEDVLPTRAANLDIAGDAAEDDMSLSPAGPNMVVTSALMGIVLAAAGYLLDFH